MTVAASRRVLFWARLASPAPEAEAPGSLEAELAFTTEPVSPKRAVSSSSSCAPRPEDPWSRETELGTSGTALLSPLPEGGRSSERSLTLHLRSGRSLRAARPARERSEPCSATVTLSPARKPTSGRLPSRATLEPGGLRALRSGWLRGVRRSEDHRTATLPCPPTEVGRLVTHRRHTQHMSTSPMPWRSRMARRVETKVSGDRHLHARRTEARPQSPEELRVARVCQSPPIAPLDEWLDGRAEAP